MRPTILQGDSLEQLLRIRSNSVQCVVTSPPYWSLRDYGVDGQIGLEASLPEFLARLGTDVQMALDSDLVREPNTPEIL